MGEVASRELRNDTRGLLLRVEAGEDVTITVDGRPVALLRPISPRPRWISKVAFMEKFGGNQADAQLTHDLAQMIPDTTDDLPLR